MSIPAYELSNIAVCNPSHEFKSPDGKAAAEPAPISCNFTVH